MLGGMGRVEMEAKPKEEEYQHAAINEARSATLQEVMEH